MNLMELFADEIVREGAITRRTLERVPEGATAGSRTTNRWRSAT